MTRILVGLVVVVVLLGAVVVGLKLVGGDDNTFDPNLSTKVGADVPTQTLTPEQTNGSYQEPIAMKYDFSGIEGSNNSQVAVQSISASGLKSKVATVVIRVDISDATNGAWAAKRITLSNVEGGGTVAPRYKLLSSKSGIKQIQLTYVNVPVTDLVNQEMQVSIAPPLDLAPVLQRIVVPERALPPVTVGDTPAADQTPVEAPSATVGE